MAAQWRMNCTPVVRYGACRPASAAAPDTKLSRIDGVGRRITGDRT